MDALVYLREQAGNADGVIKAILKPVTPEQAAWKAPGSTANTIGATFMHALATEDNAVARLQSGTSVFQQGGWGQRLNYDPAASWTLDGPADIGLMLEYAEAVSAATREYLSALKPEDLEREIETPRGMRPLAARLGIYLVGHKFQHAGEMAALLGCQGVKGLPF